MDPEDGLGYIGLNPGDESHILVATGDSGHGMTRGTIAGILLTDLILGRPDPRSGCTTRAGAHARVERGQVLGRVALKIR